MLVAIVLKWYYIAKLTQGNTVLRISRMADYATLLLSAMLDSNQPLASKALSQTTHLPLPTVRKLMKLLTESGLVTSEQGSHGGYRLAHAPENISMSAIIAAIDGPLAMTDCAKPDQGCDYQRYCHVASHWMRISQRIDAMLQGISLLEMNQPVAVPVTLHTTKR